MNAKSKLAYLKRRQDYHCAFAALARLLWNGPSPDLLDSVEKLRLAYLAFLRREDTLAKHFGDDDPNETIPHLF
jgi:hypothetical protein